MTGAGLSDTKDAEAEKRAADLQRRLDETSTALNSALLERSELETARTSELDWIALTVPGDLALETLRTKESRMERLTIAAQRNGREQIEVRRHFLSSPSQGPWDHRDSL